MISNLEREWQLEVNSEAFNSCSGWLGGLNDCFASKGFQLARIETPSGKTLFILNTHLDAGRSSSDRKAREQQIKQIIEKVILETSGETLIVAGDLNLNWNDPKDLSLLETFNNALQLKDSLKGIQAKRGWPILDYILYRNGKTSSLEVLEIGEDTSFNYLKGPLSDHPALFIKIRIN